MYFDAEWSRSSNLQAAHAVYTPSINAQLCVSGNKTGWNTEIERNLRTHLLKHWWSARIGALLKILLVILAVNVFR